MSAPKFSVGQQVRYGDSKMGHMLGKIGSVITRHIYKMEGWDTEEYPEEDIKAYGGGGKTRGRKHKHKRKTRKHRKKNSA
jgi:hypothetical protein